MPDGPENDFFATQFATAIVQESGAATQYWFGRLLRFRGTDEFVFRNFFGATYTESEFIENLKAGDIRVEVFNISNVNYAIDPNDSTLATVTMDVYIEATINGADNKGSFTLTHKVKQGWQTYESILS
jgi:hypothetical protein